MPVLMFTLTKSAGGENAYAAAPDIDLTGKFIPDYYEVRSDALNADEVVLSWDGVHDGVQLPLVANNGGQYVRVETHAQKVWARRLGAGAAAAVALVSAATNS